MKFSCSRIDLVNALNIVSKGVALRSPLEILSGVLLAAKDDELLLTATNLELGVKTSIPAIVEIEGEAVLIASRISEIVRKLSGDEVFIEDNENNYFTIKSTNAQFHMNGLSAEDYPDFPQVDDQYSFTIKEKDLLSLLRTTKDSVGSSESIEILAGVNFEIEEDQICAVSLDGYRLALRNVKLDDPAKASTSLVIPGAAVKELFKILSNSDDIVKVELSESQIFFYIGKTVFTSRLLNGEYVDYKGTIPKVCTTEVILARQDLHDACDRASVLAKEGKNSLVKMNFEGDLLTISSNNDTESVIEEIDVHTKGDDIKIAFNSKFFLDALKVIDDPEIKILLTNPFSPAVIRPIQSDEFTYMVLPVRIADMD